MSKMKTETCLGIAGLMGATAVAAGAFGAHGLEGKIPDDLMEIFQTAAHYHLIHSVVLLALSALIQQNQKSAILSISAYFFSFGILVFAGSLYILALSGTRWWGAVTPIGGVLLILGWTTLSYYCFRAGKSFASRPNQS